MKTDKGSPLEGVEMAQQKHQRSEVEVAAMGGGIGLGGCCGVDTEWLVHDILNEEPGVVEVEVNGEQIGVVYDDDTTSASRIVAALRGAGLAPRLIPSPQAGSPSGSAGSIL